MEDFNNGHPTPTTYKSRSSTNSPHNQTQKTENLLTPEGSTNKPRSASVRIESSPAKSTSPISPNTETLEVTNKPRSLSAKLESPEHTQKPRLSANKSKKDEITLAQPWVLAELTEEKKEKIIQFRNGPAAEFITAKDTDLEIIRWLTARKWDITESSKMFIASKKWRQSENIDNISEWIQNIKPYKFLLDYWPNSILPGKNTPKLRTHDGYLVIFEILADVHPDILDIVSLNDMVKFHLYIQELYTKELKRISEEKNDDSYAGIVFVYDLSSLTMNHLSRGNYNMFQEFNSYSANNYPETLRRVFLINAPPIFTMSWKVAKKFLDPVTIKKIVILGNDYKKELLSVIPAESLPKAYGGTLDYLPAGGGTIKGIKKFS
jgi:hypothetical protein